jgi:hypothetical protein
MTQSRAPLIAAIVLLLLPVLYVGTYFAMVTPPVRMSPATFLHRIFNSPDGKISNYRAFPTVSPKLYWPLEKIDRKVRPGVWVVGDLPHYGGGSIAIEPPDLSP